MIPAAWNVDSTERDAVYVYLSNIYVRPLTHTVRKHRQVDACSDLNTFMSTCCDLLTEIYTYTDR